MVICCTERQIEAMLLTLIRKGGLDLEHFMRFQRLVPRKAGSHCHKALRLMDASSPRGTIPTCHNPLCFLSKCDSWVLFFRSFFLTLCLFKSHNYPRQLLENNLGKKILWLTHSKYRRFRTHLLHFPNKWLAGQFCHHLATLRKNMWEEHGNGNSFSTRCPNREWKILCQESLITVQPQK